MHIHEIRRPQAVVKVNKNLKIIMHALFSKLNVQLHITTTHQQHILRHYYTVVRQ